MEELVHILENENCNIEAYLNQMNALSDEEVVSLFENETISDSTKGKLLRTAFDRISRLSTKSFIEVSKWAENVEEYKKHFFPKIEEMTYEEFVNLIYNGIYEPSILLEITKTNIYKEYLQLEKRTQKEWNLQCFDIQARLESFNEMEELDIIGTEILNIVESASPKTENVETAEYVYFRTLIENIDFLDLESNAIKVGIKLMNKQMKRYHIFTDKMIEFYLYIRLKELHLESICQNVLVSTEESDEFGHYTFEGNGLKGGTLKIFTRNFINQYKNWGKGFTKEVINSAINVGYFEHLSHELTHVLKIDKYIRSVEKLDGIQYLEKINTDKEFNYYVRSAALHQKMGKEEYGKFHDTFIGEVWADINAIFDSNRQLLTNFKDIFSQTQLEILVSTNAKKLVSFYTSKDGIMQSPIEKFDLFYLENIGSEKEPIVNDENPDIMNSLMMGDKIPLDVYHFLQRIANGEIKTIDLYQTLADYIKSRDMQSIKESQVEDENENHHL